MLGLETGTFIAALIGLGLALITGIWRIAASRATVLDVNADQSVTLSGGSRISGYLTLSTVIISLILITISLLARAVITGHGPFSSMYEFATAFAWGVLAMGLFFWWRYKIPFLTITGSAVALALMIFAYYQPSAANPLVPALQQSLLLTTHVASAVISYGAFTIGFGAAVGYLIRQPQNPDEAEKMDEISYQTIIIGFPFLTLVIILGALWADVAWGSYWSWDPKETASLVTWLLYAVYLHARVVKSWRGRKAAVLLIIGFAAVIFTFLGNYIFSSLHAY